MYFSITRPSVRLGNCKRDQSYGCAPLKVLEDFMKLLCIVLNASFYYSKGRLKKNPLIFGPSGGPKGPIGLTVFLLQKFIK